MQCAEMRPNKDKQYVDVLAHHRLDGQTIPIRFKAEDLPAQRIVKVLDIRPSYSLKAGGPGLRGAGGGPGRPGLCPAGGAPLRSPCPPLGGHPGHRDGAGQRVRLQPGGGGLLLPAGNGGIK